MEPSHNNKYIKNFIGAGLVFLFSALLFGLAGALEYIIPGFWRDFFSFEKIRPLHVSSAVFWILITAIGCVLYFLKEHNNQNLKQQKLIRWAFYIFVLSFVGILISYSFGIFGGREYWEFNPVFSIPITVGWILFIVVFMSNFKTLKQQPVYLWMWFTGVLFFLFTYLESNLWLIPEIRNHLVKDMTIQWKSYGSMVGSWNMLIYGSSIYLMDKIAGNKTYSFSNIAFWLYFLGLFNLMFNWGHHIYTLPTQPYVKHIAYVVSMTELFIFGRIIYFWKSSVSDAKKHFHIGSYRFLIAADVWVFLTLGLAILMSIPALNIYMHGTHVIVAHTMGATIGINTMLLLAFTYDIFGNQTTRLKTEKFGFWLINGSLLVFWISLTMAGFAKSYEQFNNPEVAYGEIIRQLRPWFYVFFVSGCGLVVGFFMVVFPLMRRWLNGLKTLEKSSNSE
ncbi:MAG: cbb3-type cytochrome c oxidase subunit I [Flavobacteriaceae bacterium]